MLCVERSRQRQLLFRFAAVVAAWLKFDRGATPNEIKRHNLLVACSRTGFRGLRGTRIKMDPAAALGLIEITVDGYHPK